jgi:hypothetical protein
MNSLPHNTFKERLARSERLIGLWVTFTGHPVAEVLAGSGFDWLLLDMEHSPNDVAALGAQLLAVRGSPSAPVVRVPVHDMAWIKRVLDAGAPNIMVPNVRSAAEAREAVSWSRFAPEGLRGVAGSTRAGNYTRQAITWRAPTAKSGWCLNRVARGARRPGCHLPRAGSGRGVHRPLTWRPASGIAQAAILWCKRQSAMHSGPLARPVEPAAFLPRTAKPKRIWTRVRRWSA